MFQISQNNVADNKEPSVIGLPKNVIATTSVYAFKASLDKQTVLLLDMDTNKGL